MTDEKYNGWRNFETWCVNLWLTNEEGTYRDVQDGLKACEGEVGKADWLKGYVEGLIGDEIQGLARDLLNASLSEVDWFEVVRSFEEK